MRTAIQVLIVAVGSTALGCRSAYYGVMETFGFEKREILVDRVEEGRDAQQDAKEQFQDALQAFKSVASFDGGDLERVYHDLEDEYEDSAASVDQVEDRIDAIEKVAEDLFDEWRAEIAQISSADLRSKSERMLEQTKDRYGDLLDAMKKAEAKMQPVLVELKDRVLFLKHNLNAQAIASLQGEVDVIDDKVAELVREMETSIAEADEFIRSMESGG